MRKLPVCIGDMLIMLATIVFMIFLHKLAHRYGVLNIRRPLKPYALYLCVPLHVFLGYIFEVYDIRTREKLRTLTSLLILASVSFCFMFGLAKVLHINQTTMIYIFVLSAVTTRKASTRPPSGCAMLPQSWRRSRLHFSCATLPH